jgi:hypothetical protein
MMASDESNERPPKDLSVPETMKIAALLAELMPPGAVGSKPATIRRADSMDDIGGIGGNNLSTPSLEIEDLDDVEPVEPVAPAPVESKAVTPTPTKPHPSPRPALTPKIAAVVTPKNWKPAKSAPPAPKADPPAPAPERVRVAAELPPTPVPPPLPAPKAADPSEEPTGDFMGRYNWKNKPELKAPAAPELPAAATDPDLIPVGNLAAASYFALVNWRNDPQRARQPRRADFGLDEQTRAVAKQNPFYVLGQPRRPERETVAEVLAEIKW